MSLQMRFVPFSPAQDKEKKNISKGTYTQNPPWHQVQPRLLTFSRFPPAFTGNVSSGSLLSAARFLIDQPKTFGPTAAGSLTINGNDLGSFDYVKRATTTVSSFSASNWFTSTEDTRSAWILIDGNLTITTGVTFTPSVRKLFTVVYVTGNLVVNSTGTITMTARGANHSGTGNSGGYTAPVDIRIGTGTFSQTSPTSTNITDPQVPATGGAGGPTITGANTANNGSAGTNGGTGGGGSGLSFSNGPAGAGSDGTCFSSGCGGGAGNNGVAGGNAVANGGKGGNGCSDGASNGGTGNPGGDRTSANPFAENGNSGTGGTLIIIVEGSFSGTGSITSLGTDARRADSGRGPGGASGGGSVTVLYGTNPSGGTVTATGGSGQTGGNGGAGTARKLAIGSN